VPNVIVWTENIALALSALDPAHDDAYALAAAAYRTELEALNSELHALAGSLPIEQRKLVTDHDSLGYLAHEYGFTMVGMVIPSLSTVASASAQELATLEEQITQEGVKAIFVGTTVNPRLAEQLAVDLGIQIVPMYTDSLSDASGPAPSYVEFMRHNMQTIVGASKSCQTNKEEE
jgi:ABC-type Zn uptake system ZnuABC Zn-binding protein ZnuA